MQMHLLCWCLDIDAVCENDYNADKSRDEIYEQILLFESIMKQFLYKYDEH